MSVRNTPGRRQVALRRVQKERRVARARNDATGAVVLPVVVPGDPEPPPELPVPPPDVPPPPGGAGATGDAVGLAVGDAVGVELGVDDGVGTGIVPLSLT